MIADGILVGSSLLLLKDSLLSVVLGICGMNQSTVPSRGCIFHPEGHHSTLEKLLSVLTLG